MSVEEQFFAVLNCDSALVGLVGGNIYPDRGAMDQQFRQMVVYERNATRNITSIGGSVLASQITMRVHCFGPNRQTAEDIADHIECALDASTLDASVQDRAGEYDPETQTHITVLLITFNTCED